MKCVICKVGKTKHGFTNVTLERENSIIIVKQVPLEICNNCGEYYLNEDVTESLLKKAEAVMHNKVELEVIQYAA